MSIPSIDMTGKVAIVTGAASGIGLAATKMFAEAGAMVIACDRSVDVSRMASTRVEPMAMDAGDEDDVIAAVSKARRVGDRLDVFFANAGITGGVRSVEDHTPDIWAEVMRVNLVGPFLALKHAAPVIEKSGGGAIVTTASVAGMRANAGPIAYSASKAGLINMVQNAAFALAGTGVRINAICPGLIETEMTRMAYDYARGIGTEPAQDGRVPMMRGGEPEEIAAVALFLASPMASYITGQALPVCGGLSASHPFGARPNPEQAAKVIAKYRQEQGR